MDPLVTVRGLIKRFDGNAGPALIDSLSFTVRPGNIAVFLGASGCGKTTILKMLAGLEPVSGGSLDSPLKRPGPQIGFVQQGERLVPWRTVLDNVGLGIELLGGSARSARLRARELLDAVLMAQYANYYPSRISGGMTQRTLLARVLALEPKLLLLDEPLGQLDIIGRRELCGVIRKCVDSNGMGAVVVTHSVEEAIALADFVHVLSRKPARLAASFAIGQDAEGCTRLERAAAFEPVLEALLASLGDGGVANAEADSHA